MFALNLNEIGTGVRMEQFSFGLGEVGRCG
jgi:hypothetical protein